MGWIGLAAALSGCLYLSPLNERPSVTEIHAPSDIHRDDRVMLSADHDDPDGDAVTYRWATFACAGKDAEGRAVGCDRTSPSIGTTREVEVAIPVKTELGELVQAVLVRLEITDVRRAVSSPAQRVLDVQNAEPTLEVRRAARTYTVGAPIELFARFGDPDDAIDGVVPVWKVFTPSTQPAYTLDDIAMPPVDDPARRTVGKTLVPEAAGEWAVAVAVSDPLGKLVEKRLTFTVATDQPPCLARTRPIIAPNGAALPVAEPTVFEVPLVDDDLDPYPALAGDPRFGGTTFVWSILPPGAVGWQVLVGATGNAVDFDPAAFSPGELIGLRVEIFDRKLTGIPCAADVASCSVIAQPSCVQRQTWRVEAR